MGEATVVETFDKTPDPRNMPDEKAAQLAEAMKTKIGSATTPMEKPPETVVPPADPNRPKWLPEKFKTPEDFAKAYTELEKKQGSQPAKPADKNLSIKPGEPAKPTEGTAEAAVAKAGLDMAALNKEFAEKGDLSPESYQKLESSGIPKEMVQAHIELLKGHQAQLYSDIESVAGGSEKFAEMREWSTTNLTQAEKDAVNAAVATGDPQAIKAAYKTVHEKWAGAGQDEPEQIQGNKGDPTNLDVYRARSELLEDQRDPRYKTSELFRKQVMEKLKRSNLF